MKVKVTITGTLDLSREDVKELRGVSADHVLDTMRDGSEDMKVKIEGPGKTKAVPGFESVEE